MRCNLSCLCVLLKKNQHLPCGPLQNCCCWKWVADGLPNSDGAQLIWPTMLVVGALNRNQGSTCLFKNPIPPPTKKGAFFYFLENAKIYSSHIFLSLIRSFLQLIRPLLHLFHLFYFYYLPSFLFLNFSFTFSLFVFPISFFSQMTSTDIPPEYSYLYIQYQT